MIGLIPLIERPPESESRGPAVGGAVTVGVLMLLLPDEPSYEPPAELELPGAAPFEAQFGQGPYAPDPADPLPLEYPELEPLVELLVITGGL